MSATMDGVRERIEILRSLDGVENALRHNYNFNPPLTEQEVRDWEAAHHVALPEDYKQFLIEVGNGGMGPCYGLYRLELFAGSLERQPMPDDYLTTPFRYSPEFPFDESASYTPETDNYDIYDTSGTITLSAQGCGYFDVMVVCGEDYGSVWVDGRVSDQGVERVADSFLDWYDGWLVRSIEALASRDAFDALLRENAVACSIETVVAAGRCRGLSVKCPAIPELRKLQGYEPDEFISNPDKGEVATRPPAGTDALVGLFLDELGDVPVVERLTRLMDPSDPLFGRSFYQPNSDNDDIPTIGSMYGNAETVITGRIVEVFHNKFDHAFYHVCDVPGLPVKVFLPAWHECGIADGRVFSMRGRLCARFL